MSFQKTKDGSLTYISPIYGAAFHSRHGAILESEYVFIKHGLSFLLRQHQDQIRIFEMGFGSGLNVLLSILYSLDHKLKSKIFLETIEKHPLPQELADQMNFCEQLSTKSNCAEIYNQIHEVPWNVDVKITDHFKLKKVQGDLLKTELPKNNYDLIYYDAFAPSSQKELWSDHVCQQVYSILRKGGILTTYCAQGQFKRNLKAVGFTVEELPGPPGKREMTRAIKS